MSTEAAPKPKVTPKQNNFNKIFNIKNEILVSLYGKRDLGQASENNRKERVERSDSKRNSTKRQRGERKRKLESIEETTLKKLMNKAASDLCWPEKCNNLEFIKTISQTVISRSPAHEQCHNEVIRTVKTLDQLTEVCKSWSVQVETILNLLSFVALKP